MREMRGYCLRKTIISYKARASGRLSREMHYADEPMQSIAIDNLKSLRPLHSLTQNFVSISRPSSFIRKSFSIRMPFFTYTPGSIVNVIPSLSTSSLRFETHGRS